MLNATKIFYVFNKQGLDIYHAESLEGENSYGVNNIPFNVKNHPSQTKELTSEEFYAVAERFAGEKINHFILDRIKTEMKDREESLLMFADENEESRAVKEEDILSQLTSLELLKRDSMFVGKEVFTLLFNLPSEDDKAKLKIEFTVGEIEENSFVLASHNQSILLGDRVSLTPPVLDSGVRVVIARIIEALIRTINRSEEEKELKLFQLTLDDAVIDTNITKADVCVSMIVVARDMDEALGIHPIFNKDIRFEYTFTEGFSWDELNDVYHGLKDLKESRDISPLGETLLEDLSYAMSQWSPNESLITVEEIGMPRDIDLVQGKIVSRTFINRRV